MTTFRSKGNSKKEYLTKRVLKRAVRKGFKQASQEAMDTSGSIVVTKDNWVVRQHKDGRIERIEEIDRTSASEIKRKLEKLAS